MKNDKEFNEVQRFNHPLLLAAFGLSGIYVVKEVLDVMYRADATPGEVTEKIVWASTFGILALFFLLLTLKTRINDKGISVKFFPFHIQWVLYKWDNIENVEVRNYSPLSEFGGWGIRFGKGKSKMFSTRGNEALHITFKEGPDRYIGTQKGEEVGVILERFNSFRKGK